MAKIPVGRPSKYKKKYCKMLIEFFSRARAERILKEETIYPNGKIHRTYVTLAAGLPTFNKFSTLINVWPDQLHGWAHETYPDHYEDELLRGEYKHPEFHNAYMKAKKLQRDFLVDNALAGLTPPASFIFVATNITEFTNKASLDHTTQGQPLKVTMVSYAEAIKKQQESKPLELPAITK